MCVWVRGGCVSVHKQTWSCCYYSTCYLAPESLCITDRPDEGSLICLHVPLVKCDLEIPNCTPRTMCSIVINPFYKLKMFDRFHIVMHFRGLERLHNLFRKLGSLSPGTHTHLVCSHYQTLCLHQKSHLASSVSCTVDVPPTRDHRGSPLSPRESSHSPSILQPNLSLFSHCFPLPSPPPPPLLPFQSWRQMVF